MAPTKIIVAVLVLVCFALAGSPACSVGPLRLSNHPQLFLDDYIISSMFNLHRDMKHPRKHPQNPVMVSEYPWEKRYMFVTSVVYNPDEEKFMAWYTASEDSEGNPEYYTCYAESKDGVHWEKPMIGKKPFDPYKKHNILGIGGCAARDPDDLDPGRRYKSVNSSYSRDGIDWVTNEECRQNWCVAVGKNDTVPSFVWWNGEYLAYVRYQGDESRTAVRDSRTGYVWKDAIMRCAGLCVSKDFCHWTKKQLVFTTDEEDGYPWTQAHGLSVTAYGDVLIGLLPLLHMVPMDGNNFLGDFDVQLIVSRDGRKWDRVADRAVFMPCEKPEPMVRRSWDFRFHPTANFFVKDDVVYIYYFGTNTRHGEGRSTDIGGLVGNKDTQILARRCGMGLATLPADRFVSLRPINWAGEGILETKPFVCSGDSLLVNADLRVGALGVEITDETGAVMPGYSRRQSELSVRDPMRYSVVWKQDNGEERTLGHVWENQPIALRFIIENGDLYSFQIVDGE